MDEHMEEIFGVMDCTERQMAILVAFKLERKAKPWWKAAKKTFNGEETEITGNFFKREFFKRFNPEHIRYEKMLEF